MHASRNLSLCTKDCLCLFVCPSGATNTETGQIDEDACLDGCRLCVDACPSHAIYLVMDSYSEPLVKAPSIVSSMLSMCNRKHMEEKTADLVVNSSGDPMAVKLAKALKLSCRIVAEDCARESGYMLPQSNAVKELVGKLLNESRDEVKSILQDLI